MRRSPFSRSQRSTIVLGIMAIVLLVKPAGLFGKER